MRHTTSRARAKTSVSQAFLLTRARWGVVNRLFPPSLGGEGGVPLPSTLYRPLPPALYTFLGKNAPTTPAVYKSACLPGVFGAGAVGNSKNRDAPPRPPLWGARKQKGPRLGAARCRQVAGVSSAGIRPVRRVDWRGGTERSPLRYCAPISLPRP